MSEFHTNREIKATRKAHWCEQCGKAVPVGASAHYASGKYDGEIYASYSHIECHAAAREFFAANNLYDDEWPWFQHMEDSEFEHHAWLLEKHPLVAERLNITKMEEPA